MKEKFISAIFAVVAYHGMVNAVAAMRNTEVCVSAIPPNQLIRSDGMLALFGTNPTEQCSAPQGVLLPLRPDETIRPQTLRYEAPPQPWREYSF